VTRDERVAVVTGGASGIGLATCEAFLKEGLRVAAVDIDLEAAERAASELDPSGERAAAVRADVTSTESVNAMVQEVLASFGGIDVLVNNAGIINPGPSEEVGDEDWRALTEVHLGGTFRCSRAAFSALAASDGGAIVNVASVAAHMGFPMRLSYCASKAGIEGMTRTLAVEWAPHGIRVNAVAPGYTLTPLVRQALDRGLVEEARVTARTPLARLGHPEEIAAGIAFLASAKASYITGHTLVIDGGMVINGSM
jgi:NAD(P)-dependent dehydrogenase (short-subunit alcohol dehydrogenase family)